MDQSKFKLLQDFLIETSGLYIEADKMYLVESRLAPVARSHGCTDVDALTLRLGSGGGASEALRVDVVEAMTTNETSFFRDAHPFEAFKNTVLPELTRARASRRSLRILCAASSSGQEPYSLAMTIRESAPELASWKVEIVGTDIDNKILERARTGRYSKFEIQRGLPISFLVKYFDQESDNAWKIKKEVSSLVRFEHGNLLKSIAHLGKFDVVFCRNVLIYFTPETKARVLDKLANVLTEDGTLFLGGAESVLGVSESFSPRPGLRGLYAPSRAAHAVAA